MNSIITVLLGFFWLSGGWGNNLEKALADAGPAHKLVILNFSGSDWCGPCILLKKEVFESEEFKRFADTGLELVRADFPRQKKNQLPKEQVKYNESLAEKYNPAGKFPLTLLLSPEGKVLRMWEGYPKDLTTEQMIKTIQSYR
ncbi:thioredoxin family protein [Leadbetterella sp. DM7]|uniref:thioredoxin family protein n=1 Tax=Leadbetterella sp. DM7 TaxID=3235085 RepID=UPI00349EC429